MASGNASMGVTTTTATRVTEPHAGKQHEDGHDDVDGSNAVGPYTVADKDAVDGRHGGHAEHTEERGEENPTEEKGDAGGTKIYSCFFHTSGF